MAHAARPHGAQHPRFGIALHGIKDIAGKACDKARRRRLDHGRPQAQQRLGGPITGNNGIDRRQIDRWKNAGQCRMRFRPYPPRADKRDGVFALTLEPRSAYVLQRDARWRWQHMIPPTPELRYSITFRTRVERRRG